MQFAGYSPNNLFSYRTSVTGPVEICVADYITFMLTVIVERFWDISNRAGHVRDDCDPVIMICITDTARKG